MVKMNPYTVSRQYFFFCGRRVLPIVVVVVLTLTRIIKSVVTGPQDRLQSRWS